MSQKDESSSQLGAEVTNKDLLKALRKNAQVSEQIFESLEKIRRYYLLSRIVVLVQLLIVALPIILAFIYLPSAIRDLINYFQSGLAPLDPLLKTNLLN